MVAIAKIPAKNKCLKGYGIDFYLRIFMWEVDKKRLCPAEVEIRVVQLIQV